ncbi:MAG TPA: hypothetical protein DCQ36_06230 [Actinobacteria bacterium]|jgi:nitrite reductase/ring-hydroxylating ferredoxin subunit|nr:hypothetical protein [Actinomycetota bacterium]
MERRTLLKTGGVVVSAAVVAACSSGGDAAPVDEPSAATPEDAQAGATTSSGSPLASAGDVPVGGGVIIAEPAIVVTQPTAGEYKAFVAICPHQGCLVSEVVDNEIICPCHGSRFSASDGAVLEGPSRQGLSPAGVAVEGGSVVLS